MTLNRPAVLNAINVAMLQALLAALREARDAGAILVRAAGSAFCAGEDLRQTLAPETGEAAELRASFEGLQDVTRLMAGARCPVVSAVQGYAVGGGAEIALAADFVVAGPRARMRFPEAVIGHAPTGGITARLTAMVGLLRAKDLLLSGRWVDADEALRIGLVGEVVADPGPRGLELATELASRPRRSMAAVKRAVELAAVPQGETFLQLEVDATNYCFGSAETSESFVRFRGTGRPLAE